MLFFIINCNYSFVQFLFLKNKFIYAEWVIIVIAKIILNF